MTSFYLVIIYYNYDTQDNMKGDFIMRYRCIGKYEYSWKDVDEDGNEINYSEKVAVLMSNYDHNMISKIGFTSEKLDDEIGLRFNITGPKTCIYHSDNGIDITLYLNASIKAVVVDILLVGNNKISPRLRVSDDMESAATCIPLFIDKEDLSRTTVIVLSFSKENPTSLDIYYHHLEKTHNLVSMNGEYSVFEEGDVFEIDVNDYYDKMSIYDPKTEEELPMVHVNGNWFDNIFEED